LCGLFDTTGHGLVSRDAGEHWSAAQTLAPVSVIAAISCADAGYCVASSGTRLLRTTDGATWTSQAYRGQVRGLACAADSVCVGVDSGGNALYSADAGVSWSVAPTGAPSLTAVSCSTSRLCVAFDQNGNLLLGEDADSGPPAWTAAGLIDPGGVPIA